MEHTRDSPLPAPRPNPRQLRWVHRSRGAGNRQSRETGRLPEAPRSPAHASPSHQTLLKTHRFKDKPELQQGDHRYWECGGPLLGPGLGVTVDCSPLQPALPSLPFSIGASSSFLSIGPSAPYHPYLFSSSPHHPSPLPLSWLRYLRTSSHKERHVKSFLLYEVSEGTRSAYQLITRRNYLGLFLILFPEPISQKPFIQMQRKDANTNNCGTVF